MENAKPQQNKSVGMGMYKQAQGWTRECPRERNGVSNVAEGQARVRDSRATANSWVAPQNSDFLS